MLVCLIQLREVLRIYRQAFDGKYDGKLCIIVIDLHSGKRLIKPEFSGPAKVVVITLSCTGMRSYWNTCTDAKCSVLINKAV